MHFRIARHTSQIDTLTQFYCEVIGLNIIGEFKDHSGYNGVFLGKETLNWHLEFTQSETPAEHTFDEDDLMVFYPETRTDYDSILERIKKNRSKIYKAKNPYWVQNGILIKDPDGYGIMISHLKIKP